MMNWFDVVALAEPDNRGLNPAIREPCYTPLLVSVDARHKPAQGRARRLGSELSHLNASEHSISLKASLASEI